MTLVLTDDELVAAAVLRGTVWFGMLPTVTDSVDDLVAASARGLRSLAVRGMLSGGGSVALNAEVDAVVAPTLGVRPSGLAYVATEANPGVAEGEVFAVFPAAEPHRATAVVTLSNGISEIEVLDATAAVGVLRTPIRSAFTTGVSAAADGSSRVLVYLADPTEPHNLQIISPGVVARGTLSEGDGAFGATETLDRLPDGM